MLLFFFINCNISVDFNNKKLKCLSIRTPFAAAIDSTRDAHSAPTWGLCALNLHRHAAALYRVFFYAFWSRDAQVHWLTSAECEQKRAACFHGRDCLKQQALDTRSRSRSFCHRRSPVKLNERNGTRQGIKCCEQITDKLNGRFFIAIGVYLVLLSVFIFN